MSEPPEDTQPVQPLDQGGVPPSWSPAWQQRTVSQPGIPPSAPGTQGAWPGVSQGVPQLPPAATLAAQDHPFVSLTWDGVLLIITVALVGAALATTHQAHLADIIRPIGYLGLIATGFALSLRTGAPNLAVGAIAGTTGVIGAHLAAEGSSLWTAMAEAVAIATGAGLITGLVVAALSVPAWAATLALAALAESAAFGISNDQLIPLHVGGTYPAGQWIAAFVAVSVVGGALWLVPGVRSALSKTRSAGEPGRWAGLGPGLGAVVGLAGSSLLAGAGGASMAMYELVAQPPSNALNLTLIAFAATAVGGVSVYGRRAGVLGTVLGVVIVQTVVFLMTLHAISASWFNFALGGLIVLGLAVNRVLESATETLNRRRAPGVAPPGYGIPGPGMQPHP